MQVSSACVNLVKGFEKCRLQAFKPIPTDPWTLGWGRTSGIVEGQTCTQDEADAWLLDDIERAADGVLSCATVELTQGQMDGLTSFAYNVGVAALAKSTLMRLLNAGDAIAAAEEFPKWSFSAGKFLEGLHTRRLAEKALFQS